MKKIITLLLTLLLGISAATAQNHNIIKPAGDGWDETPSSAETGSTVTIKYTGNKYVKDVTLNPSISLIIEPSCLSMFVGETVSVFAKSNSDIFYADMPITFSSDKPSVVSISNLNYGTTKVTANALGEATITATDAKGRSAYLTITVKAEPDNCIAGFFSVGEDSKVVFSKGNLQYNVTEKTWRFAENQWDYVGGTETSSKSDMQGMHVGNVLGSTNTNVAGPWIDLFGHGTWLDDGNPTNISTSALDYYNASIITFAVANNNSAICSEWKTLSDSEWGYLLETRTNHENLYALGWIGDVMGLILLPDNWTEPPDGLPFSTKRFHYNVYSKDEWKRMENVGAVFLPAAGVRNVESVVEYPKLGMYFGAYASNRYGEHIDFSGISFAELTVPYGVNHGLYIGEIGLGCSVRLVRHLPNND